ncbi:hypothetical protein [Duganella qianjiadongensis]|uniref:Uncharacterized protein n=1 Tax=Duganella qianjiadongensis TaxID=2692176 RepID=A0ABW9VSZ4_9BURK|nr:hypothetical protein [Duganella qianjiadongensis]MYM42196.1 hypothetical protein [Duganella qianjiadongensis]
MAAALQFKEAIKNFLILSNQRMRIPVIVTVDSDIVTAHSGQMPKSVTLDNNCRSRSAGIPKQGGRFNQWIPDTTAPPGSGQ